MAKLSTEALGYSAAALQSGDLNAALAVRDREYGQNGGTFDDSVVRTMELILIRTPALLGDCPQEILEPLRIAAAMMELWGTNRIREFVTIEGELDYRFDAEAIGHMLHSHACCLESLERFREVGINRVKLLGSHDSDDCEACREADGASFTIDTVPELPLATCRCETGYGCRVIVVADDRVA
jgi:hypothetical protein